MKNKIGITMKIMDRSPPILCSLNSRILSMSSICGGISVPKNKHKKTGSSRISDRRCLVPEVFFLSCFFGSDSRRQ